MHYYAVSSALLLGGLDLASAQPTFFEDAVCGCEGAMVDTECLPTLQAAFDVVSNGGRIRFGGKKLVDSNIVFDKSVSLIGVDCLSGRATISATFDGNETGILEARGPNRLNIVLNNVVFTNEPGGLASAFHGGGIIIYR